MFAGEIPQSSAETIGLEWYSILSSVTRHKKKHLTNSILITCINFKCLKYVLIK